MICRILCLTFILMIFAMPAMASDILPQTGKAHLSIETRDSSRSYTAYAPETAPAQNAALVVALHGFGGSGDNIIEQGKWQAAADRHGFLLIAPDGITEHKNRRASFIGNPRNWNAGDRAGTWASQNGIDDTGLLRTLVTRAVASGRVDKNAVFVTGFSNGAGMTFRAGAELSDIVAAIAPVSNGLLVDNVKLARPVPLLLIWGDKDPINPFAGGEVKRGHSKVRRPGAAESFGRWARMLGCTDAAETSAPAPKLTETRYQSCDGGAEARFITVSGMGHQWPSGKNYMQLVCGPGSDALDATEEIWAFFARHKRSD